MSPTVLTVVGARPQFIKAAPVSRALAEAGFQELLVHTGQHYDPSMSEVFFIELGLSVPWRNLAVGSGKHGAQTAAMLVALEAAIEEAQPDVVLIYGDTNSTLAGALAASKLHVPVAHVEAGLRSFNRRMPEEINRLLADAVSTWCFVPTEVARGHLLAEGVDPKRVHWVGDVMADAVRLFQAQAPTPELGLGGGPYALSTLHRASLVDQPEVLANAWQALNGLAELMPVVVPLHPRTAGAIAQLGLPAGPHLRVLPPQPYLSMLGLLKGAEVVVTDSGGLQKEAYLVGRPCVTMRDETEWTELVSAGWNVLVGERPTPERLQGAVAAFSGWSRSQGDLYGDGHAARRIVEALQASGVGV